jgi:8-oxo-dGTP diphosphatase
MSVSEKNAGEVAVAVVVDRDKILMVLRKDTTELSWVFPGGKVEPGESGTSAVRRELMEEVGLRCRVKAKIGSRIHPVTERNISYFLCYSDCVSPRNMEPHKASRVAWFSMEEIEKGLQLEIYPPVKREILKSVNRAMSIESGPLFARLFPIYVENSIDEEAPVAHFDIEVDSTDGPLFSKARR